MPEIEVLIPESRIQARIAELGAQISADYEGQTVVLVGVLKGSFMFMADLCRQITVPVRAPARPYFTSYSKLATGWPSMSTCRCRCPAGSFGPIAHSP